MWRGVYDAIGAKLLGLDPTEFAVKRTTDLGGVDRGFKVTAFDGQKSRTASSAIVGYRELINGGIKTSIPVWKYDSRGHRTVDVWPSISYQLAGYIFAPVRYIWRADRIRKPTLKTPLKEIELKDQKAVLGKPVSQTPRTTVTGPVQVESRAFPEPYDLIFAVRFWSKDPDQDYEYQRLILDALPARGKIDTVQQDGTVKSWEMYQQSVNNVDDEEPTSQNPEQRGFSWVYTYAVETFLDNTTVTELRKTVLGVENQVEVL